MERARTQRRWVAVGVVATVVWLGAAGCGTTGDTEGTGAPATAAPVDEPTDEPTDDSVEDPTDEPTDGTVEDPTDEPTDPSQPLDACDLLTGDDVAEAFDEPVEPGEANGADECWWYSEDQLKTVNLLVSEPDLDEWRSGLENDAWEPVDLGDEGYRGVSMFDTIEFRVGDVVYEINVIYSTAGDPEAVLEELADGVAARL